MAEITISQDLYDRLEKQAKANGQTIEEYLDQVTSPHETTVQDIINRLDPNNPYTPRVRELLEAGKNPLTLLNGLATSEAENDLSERVREIMRESVGEYGFKKRNADSSS